MLFKDPTAFLITQIGLVLGAFFFFAAGALGVYQATVDKGLYDFFTSYLLIWIFILRKQQFKPSKDRVKQNDGH